MKFIGQFPKPAFCADSSPRVQLSRVTMGWLAVTALVLTAIVWVGAANAQQYGAWLITRSDDNMLVAGTSSVSGEVLRIMCESQGSCVWLLTTSRRCEQNISVDALATSDKGTLALELACYGIGTRGQYDLVFKQFEPINRLVYQGGIIGFAIATKGGQFQVLRFDTDGAQQAIAEASRRAGTGSRIPARGLKDERL